MWQLRRKGLIPGDRSNKSCNPKSGGTASEAWQTWLANVYLDSRAVIGARREYLCTDRFFTIKVCPRMHGRPSYHYCQVELQHWCKVCPNVRYYLLGLNRKLYFCQNSLNRYRRWRKSCSQLYFTGYRALVSTNVSSCRWFQNVISSFTELNFTPTLWVITKNVPAAWPARENLRYNACTIQQQELSRNVCNGIKQWSTSMASECW